MKLKKLKINQKFLELFLLKLRIYDQYNKHLKSISTNDVNQTLVYFKKALKILFKFHTKNKKILFVGLKSSILKKINKETIHMAMPSRVKLQNTLFNKTKFKNNSKFSLLKLKKNPKLVIIFDKIDHYVSFVNEVYNAKIPIITFGKSFSLKENILLYNVPATPEFLVHNKNLFCNCLKFLFKKPKITSIITRPLFIKSKTTKPNQIKKSYIKYGKKKKI